MFLALLPFQISIHPPRVGWDCKSRSTLHFYVHFNPPTPCGVGRIPLMSSKPRLSISIHPPRVGWDTGKRGGAADRMISIHPPRVGWDPVPEHYYKGRCISIHPPRVGWDGYLRTMADKTNISIHPPRVGWDPPTIPGIESDWQFQSTHPVWGGTCMRL